MLALEVQLFRSISEKLGEKSAQDLIEFVKTEVEQKVSAEKNQLATKQDIQSIKKEMEGVKLEIESVKLEIEKSKSFLLQWFIGGLFGFSALIITLIKLL
ncbi:MAG: CCDC90 family protein [Cytophagales bacterium]|nr:CCDC90 family protein [Cytophagales bacterium]